MRMYDFLFLNVNLMLSLNFYFHFIVIQLIFYFCTMGMNKIPDFLLLFEF